MKRSLLLLLAVLAIIALSCNKEKVSERFTFLTSHTWTSDSLLANGQVDAAEAYMTQQQQMLSSHG